jgi:hypothetical protein
VRVAGTATIRMAAQRDGRVHGLPTTRRCTR